MAKDAKGHGSEKRGGASPQDQLQQAAKAQLNDLRTNPSGPHVAAGVDKSGRTVPVTVSDAEAAKALAGGGAKSALVDVHPAMGHGPFPSNADFVAKYGGPRDHAAEQRGFNSGKREINRLKRQGK